MPRITHSDHPVCQCKTGRTVRNQYHRSLLQQTLAGQEFSWRGNKPALAAPGLVLLMIMQVGLVGRNRVENHGLNVLCRYNYLMYIYLSKILPMLVLPPGVVVFLVLLALFFVLKGMRKMAVSSLMLALAILWTASMPIVANRLALVIEAHYPAISLDRIPDSGCIVLLGGFVSAPLFPRRDIELNDSVDRLFKAAELYFAGKAPVVIVTGGRQSWSSSQQTEAGMMRDLLKIWQVPDQSIMMEGQSRNTRENALFSKKIISSINCEQPLLVTSAAHMPRAVAAFERVGITVFPVSADIRAAEDNTTTPMDFLPDARALLMTATVLREWIGQTVYRWREWN